MFPQTHVHFARKVLGRMSDTIALGSIFPDMIISPRLGHKEAHSLGGELMHIFREDHRLLDFARGVVTHGIEPGGLDYYGDEQYLDFERGYCFEKARPLVKQTTIACNIPPHMGWWKAHNIVEMGVELYVSGDNRYGDIIRRACNNKELIADLGRKLPPQICPDTTFLSQRMSRFPHYIEVDEITPESLAKKYRLQMYTRHGVQIDTVAVAKLISEAAEIIASDIEDFFTYVEGKIIDKLEL